MLTQKPTTKAELTDMTAAHQARWDRKEQARREDEEARYNGKRDRERAEVYDHNHREER